MVKKGRKSVYVVFEWPLMHCDLFSEFWSDYWQKVKLGILSFFQHFTLAKVPNLHGLTKKIVFLLKSTIFLTSKLGKNQIFAVLQHFYVVVGYKLLIFFYHLGKNGEKVW